MPLHAIEGRSTRAGARPQAILHPHGNRGADLIETIRLERLSAQVADKNPLLKPDRTLFVPPHHSDVRAEGVSSKPGVGGPGERPWAEKRWNRPQTAGALRVHSAKELQDMLTEERERGDGASTQGGSRLGSPLPQSPLPDGRASRGTPHEMASR